MFDKLANGAEQSDSYKDKLDPVSHETFDTNCDWIGDASEHRFSLHYVPSLGNTSVLQEGKHRLLSEHARLYSQSTVDHVHKVSFVLGFNPKVQHYRCVHISM